MIGNQGNLDEASINNEDELVSTLVNTDVYRDLIKRKKRFFIKAIIFFICFYFSLPLGIILFPSLMSIVVFHHLTIAWLVALLQFVMIWGLGGLYYFKAKQFDRLIEKLGPWGNET